MTLIELTPAHWLALARLRPGAVALLRSVGVTKCLVESATYRTKLQFVVPEAGQAVIAQDPRRHEFDRQIDFETYSCIVFDGQLDDLATSTIHVGRVPCTMFYTGCKFWVDIRLIPKAPIMLVRDIEVTILLKQNDHVTLVFPNGEQHVYDIAELRLWAWVPEPNLNSF